MTPAELKEIQLELGLSDPDFAAALELKSPELAALKSDTPVLSNTLAERAEQLLDDWRYASLILERKIRPQFDDLVAGGEKPAKIALITQLDRDNPEYRTATKQEARLSLFKQIDKLAKAFFVEQEIEVVSRVEYIKAPQTAPGEERPRELSVLGVRVELL